MGLEYPKRHCRVLGPQQTKAVLFDKPGGKQPQKSARRANGCVALPITPMHAPL
jgi:hypothetical protein